MRWAVLVVLSVVGVLVALGGAEAGVRAGLDLGGVVGLVQDRTLIYLAVLGYGAAPFAVVACVLAWWDR